MEHLPDPGHAYRVHLARQFTLFLSLLWTALMITYRASSICQMLAASNSRTPTEYHWAHFCPISRHAQSAMTALLHTLGRTW
jgi:hypothetical protein